jgi:hypothetical protein
VTDISTKIEKIIADEYDAVLTSRKDIGDFYINENRDAVNVKSNNVDKVNFSPNMVSVPKILDFLENYSNKNVIYVFVDYKMLDNEIKILETTKVNIEHIDWNCLAIRAQGKGVIQKPGNLLINKEQTREQWIKICWEKYKEYAKKQIITMNEIIIDCERVRF